MTAQEWGPVCTVASGTDEKSSLQGRKRILGSEKFTYGERNQARFSHWACAERIGQRLCTPMIPLEKH